MPIYAYRCATCGFQKDILQKLSDPKLTVCPECGKESFNKQLTAAGFLLKGSGWYATDFKGGAKSGDSSKGGDSGSSDSGGGDSGGDKGTKSLQHACAGAGCCP